VENPFRSEAAAFQFLLITVGAFALITIAAVLNTWAGVAVFVALTGAAIGYYLHQRGQPTPRQEVTHRGEPDEKRILVVANETVAGQRLIEEIRRATGGGRARVLVVSPALNSPLRHWVSDEDRARAEAQARLDRSLRRLEQLGIEARGEVGDSDPVQAIEDELRIFGPDEVIISTHPEGRSNWLERGVVVEARARFDVPITHVVVDLEAETEHT
jgi:hypothetical protein